jgi:Zn-dependent peptidase ImmA (M78 family)/transcriptional regulator with XRE-family HTH domain
VLNQKLKLARLSLGLSLRDLQGIIENRVTAQAIGKYERGESVPSPEVLSVLCGALGMKPDQLLTEESLILEGLEFRKAPTASKKEEYYVRSKVLKLLEEQLAIEDLLGITNLSWDMPRGAPYIVRHIHDAETAAIAMRHEWGLGLGPLKNITALLEDRGIKVISLSLENIDGFAATVRTRSAFYIPVIATNKHNWSERKRFTLSHELAHLATKIIGNINSEKAAHRFGGAFLMPAEALRSELGTRRTSISMEELLYIKQIFGVSFQAIVYRAKELEIINSALFSKLFDEFEVRGWRTAPFKEPAPLSPRREMPIKLKQLCLRALSEGTIDEDTISKILNRSDEDWSTFKEI